MNSWRVGLHMCPVRVRKSIPAAHSSIVGSISRTNACRWRTSASLISRARGDGACSSLWRTTSVIDCSSTVSIGLTGEVYHDAFFRAGAPRVRETGDPVSDLTAPRRRRRGLRARATRGVRVRADRGVPRPHPRGRRAHSHEGDPASINAWVRVYEEDAVAAAARADELLAAGGELPPLLGVPLGLKDLYGVAGKPVTASSSLLADVPAEDCDVWRRLQAAGMVLLGHLHTHEFAAGGTTDQVGNPWDRARSAGGSSGGSAAALAARMVPAATGTDTAGSLRIPSACCGTSDDQADERTRLAGRGGAALLEPRPRRPDGAHAGRLPPAARRDGRPRPRPRGERAARARAGVGRGVATAGRGAHRGVSPRARASSWTPTWQRASSARSPAAASSARRCSSRRRPRRAPTSGTTSSTSSPRTCSPTTAASTAAASSTGPRCASGSRWGRAGP